MAPRLHSIAKRHYSPIPEIIESDHDEDDLVITISSDDSEAERDDSRVTKLRERKSGNISPGSFLHRRFKRKREKASFPDSLQASRSSQFDAESLRGSSPVGRSPCHGGATKRAKSGHRSRFGRVPSPENLDPQVKKRPVESSITKITTQSLQSESSQSSQESHLSTTNFRDKKGCIYVLHDDETGHVKIGMSKALKRRFYEVKRKCRKPHLTLEWNTADVISWDELQRLEKIVHWDLASFNRPYKCDCGRQHTEWFDVEIREAKRTVEMWLRYQRLRPDVTSKDLERLRTGFPTEQGTTWLQVRSTDHLRRYEFWHWKLFGEVYDESFSEE